MSRVRTQRCHRSRLRAARAVGVGLALASASVLLVGCGSISGAVSEGQQALDQGREVVESAAGTLEQADQLIRAGTELAAACAAAQAAWVPGVSPEDARRAIDDAVGIVDGVLATTPNVPGVNELSSALSSAQESLASEGGTLGLSRDSLQTACALVTLGG